MAVALFIAVLAVVAAAGCGDEDDSAQPASTRSGQIDVPVRADTAGDKGGVNTTPGGAQIAQPEPSTDTGRKVIRQESGAITITPGRPTTYRTRPAKECGSRVVGVFSRDYERIIGTKRVPMPPRPGVSATRVDDDTLVVSYDLGTVHPRCRPALLGMTVDINDDGQSGAGVGYAPGVGVGYARIRQPQGEISVEVPSHMREADVFIASVRTRQGRPSDSSRVLIGD